MIARLANLFVGGEKHRKTSKYLASENMHLFFSVVTLAKHAIYFLRNKNFTKEYY